MKILLGVEKQRYMSVRAKASPHLCDKHMRSYEKKLLSWPPKETFTKFIGNNWVNFHVFLKNSAHRPWNQKISPVTERLDPWHCSLEVKSSWVHFGGWGGVAKSSGYFGLNNVIIQVFYFSGRDIFTTDSSWTLRWQGKLLEKLKNWKFVISVTVKQQFFQERDFWKNSQNINPQMKFFFLNSPKCWEIRGDFNDKSYSCGKLKSRHQF